MPKDMEEAVTQGLRLGVRDFIRNMVGKVVFWIVGAVLAIAVIVYAFNLVTDTVTAPFKSAWEISTGWLPFGHDEEKQKTVKKPAPVRVEKPADKSADEPGFICRYTGGFNPLC